MSEPESPKYSVPAQTEQTVFTDVHEADQDESLWKERVHPRSRKRWPMVVGAIVLLLGGGLGWYWWQTTRANPASKAPAPGMGQPPGVPVKLATVETETVPETSEISSRLEARRGVDIKPEVEGRIAQILVQDGERVQQGQVIV
jgi:multidrug efflux pump subunit AcrA (membrane-fusion protein)